MPNLSFCQCLYGTGAGGARARTARVDIQYVNMLSELQKEEGKGKKGIGGKQKQMQQENF